MSLLDENAEILKGFADAGSDLGPSRRVDFSHLFPDQASAESSAADAEQFGFDIGISETDRENDHWDVTASKEMIPSAENLTTVEEQLDALAGVYNGRADGWGFFRIPKSSV